VSLGLALAAVGCGDDDDMKIKAPGVDINAEKLTGPDSAAAGSACDLGSEVILAAISVRWRRACILNKRAVC
jgi:hypothetical protein